MIPISVIIATRNEEENLRRCLQSVSDFDEVIVVDSNSTDKTKNIANQYGVPVISFTWNEQYPKKRQWCLNNLNLKHNHIFFIDADEVLTPDLAHEIKNLSWDCAGYFIKASYVWRGRVLKHGLQNNKLVLFDREKVEFPIIDDLDIEDMGEMEGHYQPVLKLAYQCEPLGQLNKLMFHYAYDNSYEWKKRHERYASWEASMIKRNAYPKDPNKVRECLKSVFRKMPMRWMVAFMHSYIIKFGFLDGCAGFDFSKSRGAYYRMVGKNI